jgi:outer membrane lipoprotein-sorting protein
MHRSHALAVSLTLAGWLSPALLPALATPEAAPDAAAGSDGSARTADAAGQALFEQILRRLSGYKDFQARFVESSESRAGTRAARESGQVYFKRPGLWCWEYTEPERKIVRVRGRDAEIAIEGDPQVSRYDLGPGDGPAGIGSLLEGGESLSRSFSARFEKGVDPQTPVLRLAPLTLSEDYEYLLVRVRRSDLAVLEVVIVDPGGNRLRFQFEDLRPDRGLADALFQFTESAAAGKGSPSRSASPGKP